LEDIARPHRWLDFAPYTLAAWDGPLIAGTIDFQGIWVAVEKQVWISFYSALNQSCCSPECTIGADTAIDLAYQT
jgi:hypothetical protein